MNTDLEQGQLYVVLFLHCRQQQSSALLLLLHANENYSDAEKHGPSTIIPQRPLEVGAFIDW